MKRSVLIWLSSLVVVFAAGVCCGALFMRMPARAAEDVVETEAGRTARENFLKAGNKEYTVLTEILKATQENQQRLEAIEKNTADTVRAIGAIRPRPAATRPTQTLP